MEDRTQKTNHNTDNNVCIWVQEEAQKGIKYYKTCSGTVPNTLNHLETCPVCKRKIKLVCLVEDNAKPRMTNGDKIRAMSDKELAEFLLKVNLAYAEPCMLGIESCRNEKVKDASCSVCFLKYLQTEVN